MKKIQANVLLAAASLLLAATSAQAAEIGISGLATFHKDKVVIDFSTAANASVRIWTDSWLSGLNFDPKFSLFLGNALIASDDDGGSLVDAGAGFYDAGLAFTAASDSLYRLVLTASSNDALGNQLSDGFSYDAATPILLSEWNQPSYDVNANDQKGGFWQVRFSGVEQANRVPEPASLLLVIGALAGMASLTKRRQAR